MAGEPNDKNVPAEYKEAVGQIRGMADSLDLLKKEASDGKISAKEYQEKAELKATEIIGKIEGLQTSHEKSQDDLKAMERTIANISNIAGESDTKSFSDMDIKGLNDMLKGNNVNGRYEKDQMDLVQKSFDLYFEGGKDNLIGAFSPEEFKYINSVIAPQGGFTIPVESSMQVTPKAFDGRGIFELVNKIPAKSGSYTDVIDLADYDKAIYGNDLTAVVEDVNDEGEVELEYIVKEQIYTKKHSRTFMEDSWNPISYYVEQMIDGMGRDTASAVVTGKTVSGKDVNGIQGILDAEEGVSPVRKINFIESENAAADLAFTWTDAIKMIRALPDKYHGNANFAMKRQTFFDLLIEKDDNGTYQTNKMLNFFTGQGSALSILNYPVVWDAGLADTSTQGNKPVLLGDFKMAYTYLERLGISIIRDDVTNARRIIFHVRRRNGGGLRLSEAIIGLKMK